MGAYLRIKVASCGNKASGIATADIDINYLRQIRKKMPLSHHRRTDVYNI